MYSTIYFMSYVILKQQWPSRFLRSLLYLVGGGCGKLCYVKPLLALPVKRRGFLSSANCSLYDGWRCELGVAQDWQLRHFENEKLCIVTYNIWCAETRCVCFNRRWLLWLEYWLYSLIVEIDLVMKSSQTENILIMFMCFYSFIMLVNIAVLCSLYWKAIMYISYLCSCDL